MKKKETENLGFLYDIYTLLHDLVYILAAITLIFVFCVRLVGVVGNSMNSTLYDGDYLALQSNVIMGDLKYGDVIVARKQSFNDGEPIVKRVIATEGQTVRFEPAEDGNYAVYVDGVLLSEPYINEGVMHGTINAPVGQDILVEDGCVFVMGDNRDHSSDSRYDRIGQIRMDQVLGKVLFIVFPGKDASGNRDFGRIGAVS